MEAVILSLIMDVLPVGVYENDCGVLIGLPEVFRYEDKRVLIKVQALFHQGFWVGDFWVMGKQWGYAGPTMLSCSERFSTLRGLMESELPNFFEHLKNNDELEAQRKFLKYYNEWASTVI
jgi:hypothetical protein